MIKYDLHGLRNRLNSQRSHRRWEAPTKIKMHASTSSVCRETSKTYYDTKSLGTVSVDVYVPRAQAHMH